MGSAEDIAGGVVVGVSELVYDGCVLYIESLSPLGVVLFYRVVCIPMVSVTDKR